jgi:hypothetical protein
MDATLKTMEDQQNAKRDEVLFLKHHISLWSILMFKSVMDVKLISTPDRLLKHNVMKLGQGIQLPIPPVRQLVMNLFLPVSGFCQVMKLQQRIQAAQAGKAK